MAKAKGVVVLSESQRVALERLVKAPSTPQNIAQRARIVLMSADLRTNVAQGDTLGVDPQRIRRWRRRWAAWQPALAAVETAEDGGASVDDLVYELLSDEHRSGRKPTFTAEQVAQIIAVACEKPSDSDREVSHWTPRELADEVIQRGIVLTISPRHIARFFRGGRSQATSLALLAEREDQGHRSRGVRPRRRSRVRDVPRRG